MNKGKSVVLSAPRKMRVEQFPVPEVSKDDGVLQVEIAGVCGSDVIHYRNHPGAVILGHEIVGRIADIGSEAEQNWGVSRGDRVVLEATFGCGRCKDCSNGLYRICRKLRGYGGGVLSTTPPFIWGGYGDYVYLPPTVKVHRISDSMPGEVAVLICAVLGNGVRWLRTVGGVTIGDTAVILGPGPQGLASVIAAKESGADQIVIVGLEHDDSRLSKAKDLGATHVVIADTEVVSNVIYDITDGLMADVVIDVTNSADSVGPAIDLVRPRGTVVLAGSKGSKNAVISSDNITMNEISVIGVNTHDSPAVEQALSIAEKGKYPLETIVSHRFPISEAELAIQTLSGELSSEGLIKVVMYPDG